MSLGDSLMRSMRSILVNPTKGGIIWPVGKLSLRLRSYPLKTVLPTDSCLQSHPRNTDTCRNTESTHSQVLLRTCPEIVMI